MSKTVANMTAAALLMTGAAAAQQATFPATVNPKAVLTPVPNSSHPVMGVGFLSDGRMVVLTTITTLGQGMITDAGPTQALYLVSGLSRSGSLAGATFTKIVDQLTGPPPGVVVVNDTIYFMDRTAFYRVNSLNPTGGTSKAQNATRIINAPTLDSNFVWLRGVSGHQYVFTPQYHNGRFYAPYSASIATGGVSNAPPTSTYSGAMLSWAKDVIAPVSPPNAGFVKESGGIRSPNGMGTNGEYMLYADNQGSFNPGSPIHIFKPGQPQVTYGTRQSTAANAAGTGGITNTRRNWAEDLPYQPPVIWIPYGAPFASVSQPLYLDHGPYKGYWMVGDVNAGGIGRLFVDNVDGSGRYQASFHLLTGTAVNSTGSSEGKAINRMAMSPDSAIYIGTILRIGNWPTGNPGPVIRLSFRDTAVFEILAVRSRKNAAGNANGVEVFFSQPVNPATVTTSSFSLQQNNYALSAVYGCSGAVCTTRSPQVTAVALSTDNRKAFLTIATPDTSIGASHFGTLGVGNNPPGVWGGPGKQDRTLRVTVNGVTSAAGGSLFHNVAWLGWHFQAEKRFDPANTDPVPTSIDGRNPEASRLAASVTVHALPGALNVTIGRSGPATVSLYTVNGTLRQELSGAAGSFRFDTRGLARGVHVLRVKHGGVVHARALML